MRPTRLSLTTLENREVPAIMAAISALTPAVTEGVTGALKTVSAEITLSNPCSLPVTVNYRTAGTGGSAYTLGPAVYDGVLSATTGVDFVAKSSYVVFQPGQIRQVVPFQIRGDAVFEADETFGVAIQIASVGGYAQVTLNQRQTTFTILNDDLAPLAIRAPAGQLSLIEGNPGEPKSFELSVTLNRASAGTVKVSYATRAGTAAADDFTPISGVLTFLPGETSKRLVVAIRPDTQFEPTESFYLDLSNPVGGNIGTGRAELTILNDDAAPKPSDAAPQPTTHFVVTRANAAGGIDWAAGKPGQAPAGLPAFGLAGDTTVMGDWNGDGKSDLSVARKNAATGLLDWYLDLNGDGYLAEKIVSFGFATDTPLVGDFDRDGLTDLVAVRKNAQTGLLDWFIDRERNGYNGEVAKAYGWNTDRPIIGDWNRDGRADMGVTRSVNGTMQWLLDTNNGADTTAEEVFLHGSWADEAVAADWNNDGVTDIGLVRQGDDGKLYWLIDLNNDRGVDVSYAFGAAGDRVLAGRF